MIKPFSTYQEANEVRDSICDGRNVQNNVGSSVDFTAKVLTLSEVVAAYITGTKDLEDGFYIVTSSRFPTESGWRQRWRVRGANYSTTAVHIPTLRRNMRSKAERVVDGLFKGQSIVREIDWAIAGEEINGILDMGKEAAVEYVESRFLAAKGL